jgi:hypothetical protein
LARPLPEPDFLNTELFRHLFSDFLFDPFCNAFFRQLLLYSEVQIYKNIIPVIRPYS